eukprot:scaffold4780_cov120-Isochrysis_galbana.AAC.1
MTPCTGLARSGRQAPARDCTRATPRPRARPPRQPGWPRATPGGATARRNPELPPPPPWSAVQSRRQRVRPRAAAAIGWQAARVGARRGAPGPGRGA